MVEIRGKQIEEAEETNKAKKAKKAKKKYEEKENKYAAKQKSRIIHRINAT